MRAGLRTLLLNENTVKTLVGDRIFVNRIPQRRVKDVRNQEHIVITQISSDENNSLDGTSELRFLDFDIDCKGPTSAKAEAVSAAVRAKIKDYTGTAGSQTIAAVLFSGEADDFEPPTDDSDKGRYVETLDVQIQYVPV